MVRFRSIRSGIKKKPAATSENAEGEPQYSLEGLEGAWIPFGGGQQACPGRLLAKRIMLLSAALLIRDFDLELLVKGGKPDFHSPRFGFSVSKPTAPVPFRLGRPRSSFGPYLEGQTPEFLTVYDQYDIHSWMVTYQYPDFMAKQGSTPIRVLASCSSSYGLERHEYYEPWGQGITRCSGKAIGRFEVLSFIAWALWRYEFKVVGEGQRAVDGTPGLRVPRIDLKKPSLGMSKQVEGDDMVVEVTQRFPKN
ncbi:Pfs- NACHT and Ankyrin domain protein [Apiospora aurea]|uniref:Pfs- NACHT and Ankyrin domain protein n=1 Tax=Apiospora aurea TaxID=335848 RepID=A0ABR1QA40_9PEZI